MKLEKRHIKILNKHIPNFSIWYVLTVNGFNPSDDDINPEERNLWISFRVILNKFFKCNLIYQKEGWENEQRLTFCSGECNSFIGALNQTLIMLSGYIKNENENEV